MRQIKERFDEQSGRTSYHVGRFVYTVDGYDAVSYTIHTHGKDGLPIYVGERFPKLTSKLRYVRWEDLCEAAYRAAHLQARA